MSQINIHKRKTDQAWDQLYARLEKEALLPDDIQKKPSDSIRMRTMKWAAVIAVLCLSVGSLFFLTQKKSPPPFLSIQNNEKASALITTLEDGSIIHLSDQATLHYPVHFHSDKREVILEGNALFDVSGNKERPFFIETEKVQIEVLGTSFQVKSTQNTPFELSVTRGEVKVTTKENPESCIVKAGETALLSTQGLEVHATSSLSLFPYEVQRILFKDERMEDISHVLNQIHSGQTIQVASSLFDKRINIGFTKETSLHEMVEIICQGFNLSYTENKNVFLISERME